MADNSNPIKVGTRLSNLYINVGGQSASSLTGSSVDSKLSKADHLLGYTERMERDVNSSSTNNLFSAGELSAHYTKVIMPKVPQTFTYVQNQFAQGQNISTI